MNDYENNHTQRHGRTHDSMSASSRSARRSSHASHTNHANQSADRTSVYRPASVNSARRGHGSGTQSRTSSAHSHTASAHTRTSAQAASGAAGGKAAAAQYNRSHAHDQYSALAAEQRKKSRNKKILIGVLIALLVLLIGAGTAFAIYMKNVSENLHAGVDDDLRNALVDTEYTTEPFYMLLLGVDSAAFRGQPGYDVNTANSDSMMLLRVDVPNKKLTMVSLHRDTKTYIPGYDGLYKLNAAHALGGASLAVQCVNELCGVEISHYAELNFDAFSDMVDSLGGIEVDVPMEINDDVLPFHLDAGLQTLDGYQALYYCRSRHSYDDYGDGDIYRAANQRLVLGALAKKILASDPATIASTIQSLSQYVMTDLEVDEIIGLAQAFRGMDPSTDIWTGMEPTSGEIVDGIWYENIRQDEWDAMMQRVRSGLPPMEEDYVDETGSVLASTGSGNIEILNTSGNN